ncbi:MAG: glycosyl hydrolase, partial [Candidatus Bathyarchaeia archaeon]
TSAIGEEWYGGYCYIDNLNPEAVEAFLRSTYDAYYKRVGKWFGSAVPGIFTDEPHIAPSVPGQRRAKHPVYALPWTKDFPQYFEERKGYDLRDHLPRLFFDVGDYMKVRYDYWDTVTDLFLGAYTKKLFDWCEKHGLKYTGHYLAEDTLTSQIRCAGAAMPHYEFMHVPGIDHLGKNIDHPLTVKQVSSVAEQLGKERVLSETYGCSAQSFSFEGRKWIGDWEYILGVNLLNHHLSLYTMRGLRKRDYPPNLFYQQPWWKHNRLIEDYFARLSYALSRGKRTVDILVIHPVASAWTVYTPLNLKPAERLNASLEWLVKTLLNLHRDYELGDEKIIKGHGKVEGSSFVIGNSVYKAVILPPSITLSRNTFNLLQEYVNNGGKFIALKPTPHLIDGQESKDIQKVLSKAHVIEDGDEEALAKALKPILPRVEISGLNGEKVQEVWYHLRQDGDQQILFLANTSTERGFQTTVKLQGAGGVEEWNPFTGKVSPVPSRSEDGYAVFNLDFPPVGSHLIVLDPKKKALAPKAAETEKIITEILLGDEWSYRRLDLNALTLDYGRVKLENEKYGDLLPI